MNNFDNIVSISKFSHNGQELYCILSNNNDKYNKSIIINDGKKFEPISETPQIIESEMKAEKLNEKDAKVFINNMERYFNNLENQYIKDSKEELKNHKTEIKDADFINYTNLKTAKERIEFLKKNGIEEGMVFEIDAKAKNGNETDSSKAYFEVFKDKNSELRLRLDNKAGFSHTGYQDQIANASRLSGISAIALLSDEFAKHKLNAEYQKTGLNNQDFSSYDFTFTKKDVTKKAEKKLKEIEKQRLEKLKEKRDSQKNSFEISKLELIPKVPEIISKIYIDKNKPINEEIYTKKCFDMFKNIAAVVPEDQNISNFDKKIFKDLIGKMSKFNGNEQKQLQIFNQWVFDNKTSERMINLANLFEKTHKDGFKGYKIKRDEITKSNRDKNLEAIEDNKLPIMFAQDSVDYIYNPENNKLYNGNNQIALHRNNNMQDLKTDTYVELPQMLKQNKDFNTKKKLSCELVDAGFDEFGRKHYQMLIPCKPSKSEIKKEKDIRREEYRRTLADAKYYKKYGELPIYQTSVQSIPPKQPPLAEKKDIKNPFEKPTNESTIEEKLKYDYSNFFISMMTKDKFEPATQWTNKDNKERLMKFAKENPEKIEKIQSEAYENVRQQINNSYIRNNVNTNTEQIELANQNGLSRSKKRT